MKVRMRVILEMAIEAGVRRGWHLAHKHVENPDPSVIMERIDDAVMSEIYEYFTFEDGDFQ